MNHQWPQRMLTFKEFINHPIYEAVKSQRKFYAKYGWFKTRRNPSRDAVLNAVHAAHSHQLQMTSAGSSNATRHDLGAQTMIPERE